MSQRRQQISIDPTGDLILRMTCADSGKITLLRVCLCTMRRASPMWKDKPDPNGRIMDFRIKGISTSNETVSAVIQVLHMVHGNHQSVNLTPSLTDLHRVLIIVSKYSLYPSIVPYTVRWADHSIRAFWNRYESHCGYSAVSMAQISWHLGLKAGFYEVMTTLLRHTYIKDERRISIPAFLPLDEDANLNWESYAQEYRPMRDRPDDVELPIMGWVSGTPNSPADILSRRRNIFVKRLLYFVRSEVEPRLANDQTCCKHGHKDCDRQILGNMSHEVTESIATLVKELDHIFSGTLNNWHYECCPYKTYGQFKFQILQDLKDWRQCDVTKILEAQYRRTHFQKG